MTVSLAQPQEIINLSGISWQINTSVVNVKFRNVWRLKTDFVGDMASREVILDWCVIERSPLISQIKTNGAATDIDLFHHQIKGSGGSIVDIVFEEIWLEQEAVGARHSIIFG